MKRTVTIHDARGSRQVAEGGFPLALGGATADIALAGMDSGEPAAWIARSEEELFVQSAGERGAVLCNEAPVSASQWLHHGDVIRVGTTRIVMEAGEGGISLRAEEIVAENSTEPPLIVAPRGDDSPEFDTETTIAPVPFQPGGATGPPRRRGRFRTAAILSWSVVAVLAVVAWFVFTLRAVEVTVEPPPDRMEIQGALAAWEIGGRRLLWPGSYTVVAEKVGYHPLAAPMEVTSDSNQRFHLRLEELPGILIIDAGELDGARVLVDGEDAGLTPLAPLELEAGEYEIRIQAHRHQELTTTVEMEGKGVEQTMEAELAPLWAGVMFKSVPAGATVKVAGKAVGVTPVIAELLAGAYRYELQLSGYKRYRDTVEVEANQARTLPAVELEPADGRLVVKSQPAGAAVTVDGAYRGETPLDLPLAPGRSYTVEISRAGHEEESREVEITSGRAWELKVTLAPRLGEVEIAAVPADADLFIDGEPRGRADQTLSLVALPHKIEIRKEGFKTYQGSVTPRPGLVESIRVSLTPDDPLQDPATPRILETSQGQEMVLVEGGRFRMGASRREPGRRANETLRDVELSRPFYIATTEVANRQFREFQKEHLSGQVGGVNLEIDHHPVVRVTWNQAAMYCNWLSKQDSLPAVYQIAGGRVVAQNPMGTGYRLPTEAEWAWVARMSAGGEKPGKYPWGETLPVAPRSGNFADESADKLVNTTLDGYNDGFAATAPVDSFPPNGLGVLNMGGNVAEWVHDIYTIYPSATESFVKDPAGPEEGDLHAIRGSSWMDASVSELRLSYRDYGKKARPDVGFRIARYLE